MTLKEMISAFFTDVQLARTTSKTLSIAKIVLLAKVALDDQFIVVGLSSM
jgi:hypothetical protein